MVYLFKMVIFHGYVSDNQMVIIAKIRAVLGLNIGTGVYILMDWRIITHNGDICHENPLVMTNIAMERSTIFNGKIHDSMAIFNSYVSLPEGICHIFQQIWFVQSPQVLFAKSSRGCVSKHWFLGFQIANMNRPVLNLGSKKLPSGNLT